jgi:hypothetical protein
MSLGPCSARARWIASRVDVPAWAALGPDPLTETIAPITLHAKLARRKTQSIKEALLDQTLLAGVRAQRSRVPALHRDVRPDRAGRTDDDVLPRVPDMTLYGAQRCAPTRP